MAPGTADDESRSIAGRSGTVAPAFAENHKLHMESIILVLVLLTAVLVSGLTARAMTLPLPLVQIALGALLTIGQFPSTALEPDIFFLVFLPPLLFLDGWRIPKRDLFRDAGTILALALGLVVFTVLGIGWFVHLVIPGIPLAVAFALAAVLSPTDPIAVSAVAARVPIPPRLMHILEGEALLNDASGLVCLRFAIAASLTGTFSMPDAALSFLWLAIGGLVVGSAATLAVTWVNDRLRHFGEDPGLQILLTLLIPFGVYLTSEHIGASGILAAAAAGITMNYVENRGRATALTRIRRTAVWNSVQVAANGAIFILLGEQLPGIIGRAADALGVDGTRGIWWLPVYVLTITAGLVVLRFVWVWVSLQFTLLRDRRRGRTREDITWRFIAVTALAGVKGAVTLAGVLTLPLTLVDGSPFPARDLAIFLAMGVILTSLVLASTTLPILLSRVRLPPEPPRRAAEDAALAVAGEAAKKAIMVLQSQMVREGDDAELTAEAATRAMQRYDRRPQSYPESEEEAARARAVTAAERRLCIAGLNAERADLYRLRREHRIDDELLRRLVREVDLLETRAID
jgi:CPA1 family monovalent cation:H+ antiporter